MKSIALICWMSFDGKNIALSCCVDQPTQLFLSWWASIVTHMEAPSNALSHAAATWWIWMWKIFSTDFDQVELNVDVDVDVDVDVGVDEDIQSKWSSNRWVWWMGKKHLQETFPIITGCTSTGEHDAIALWYRNAFAKPSILDISRERGGKGSPLLKCVGSIWALPK